MARRYGATGSLTGDAKAFSTQCRKFSPAPNAASGWVQAAGAEPSVVRRKRAARRVVKRIVFRGSLGQIGSSETVISSVFDESICHDV